MGDVIFIAIIVGFFGLAALLVGALRPVVRAAREDVPAEDGSDDAVTSNETRA